MRNDSGNNKAPSGGLLRRLARDQRGNVMVMIAVALIPTAAFAGSAVDMGRLYLVRSRLQQACDAGALAGRRVMIDDADSILDPEAVRQANTFFDNNIRAGWMNTYAIKRTFAESGTQQVTGAAEAMVPMTVMRMFAQADRLIKVACAARLDIPDVDLMLVLDTTGSMACPPISSSSCGQSAYGYTRSDGTTGYAITEATGSRMGALRNAVLDFYDTMTSLTDVRSNVRYGFVPYTSTVNAGYQIPGNFILSSKHTYQSRRIVGEANYGTATDSTIYSIKQTDCNSKAGRVPAGVDTFDTSGNAVRTTVKSWTADATGSGGTCVVSGQPLVPVWRFAPYESDISLFVKGQAVQDPSKYSASLNKWQGCLEERSTTPASTFNPDSLPPDLDPDLVPTTDATKWRPMWPEQVYNRYGTYVGYSDQWNDSFFPPKRASKDYYQYWFNVGGDPDYLKAGLVSCGKAVQRLRKMTRSEVSSYVNAPEFRPQGGTYHDTGMVWGTRFISPTGPFAADTAAWPGRDQPNRNIIFMTDGEMAPSADIYGMYGIERFDNRVTGGDLDSATARHNARFRAVCQAAKARNITVWVIAFGQQLNADLQACATAPHQQHAIFASSEQELKDAFRKIAKQVASLRVYQ